MQFNKLIYQAAAEKHSATVTIRAVPNICFIFELNGLFTFG